MDTSTSSSTKEPGRRSARAVRKLRIIGPGMIITAAAIGPGTITTASVTGADYGYVLLWAVVFAIVASIVLQEMAARLGVETGEGLGEALRATFATGLPRVLMVLLILGAIAIGNAAYAVGDITGAAIAVESVTSVPSDIWVVLIGGAMFLLLAVGRYRLIELVLMGLVAVMTIIFVITAVLIGPDLGQMLLHALKPSVPAGSVITIIALVGTTVIPYSLFLHASSVTKKWPKEVPRRQALKEARLDTFFSLGLAGIVTIAVISTSAAAFFARGVEIESAGMMANQLEPLLGPFAKYFFAIGLFATSLAAAVTGPLGAAYAVSGVLGWEVSHTAWKFRAVWAAIIVVGTLFGLLGTEPIAVILFAQAANGILLPIMAIYLLVVVNRRQLMGNHKNGILGNVVGALVVVPATGLGIWQIVSVFA